MYTPHSNDLPDSLTGGSFKNKDINVGKAPLMFKLDQNHKLLTNPEMIMKVRVSYDFQRVVIVTKNGQIPQIFYYKVSELKFQLIT